MIIDKDNFKLLIEALDFWVKDCVLPVIPKNRISVRKTNTWTTNYLCCTKEWKKRYKTNPAKALCELVIDHYKFIYIRDYPIIELVNNYKYLYYWLIENKYKQNREAPLLQ